MDKPKQATHGTKNPAKTAPVPKAREEHHSSRAPHRGGTQHQPNRRRDRERMDLTPKYEPYWDRARVDEAVAAGKVVLGSFHMLPNNRKNIGFVRLKDAAGPDVYVDGLEARNRAMDGDYVAVELGPEIEREPEAAPKPSKFPQLELEHTDTVKEAADDLWAPSIAFDSSTKTGTSATAAQEESASRLKQRAGKIVAVLAVSTGGTMTADREFTAKHVGKLVAACDSKLLQRGRHLPTSETFAYFVPSDTRVPRMRILRSELPYEFTQDPLVHGEQFLYLGKINAWNPSEKDPTGSLLGRLGQAGEIATETEALLMENDVNHGEFPQAALDCLKEFLPPREVSFDKPAELWWKIPEEEFKKRLDLRNTLIFTVDPYTAKDIDDALHCTPMPDGTYEMGVHIADVSYFVKPGSALDQEAVRRCTSVYLVQKVIPMLPALLSEELCSLNPNVDRLAFSCIWRMKPTGELDPKHPPWFGRTIIRSACKLHYGLAQKIIDDGPGCEGWDEPGRVPEQGRWTKEQVCEGLRHMHLIGMARRKLRFDPERGGALEMQTRKMAFEIDKETGNPLGVRDYPLHDTNRLIEEYMLLANFLVAQRLIQHDRKNAFLRHHPPPDTKEMQKMVEVLRRSSGVSFFENGKISPSAIQEALRSLRTHQANTTTSRQAGSTNTTTTASTLADEESSLKVVASELLKKPMKNALYFVASELDENAWRHWALNIKYYTHFTSPIRRYADVCVHRQLAQAIAGPQNAQPITEKDRNMLLVAAERCNEKKDASRLAQDASDTLYLNLLVRDRFAKHVPFEARAVVLDMGPKSFTAFMPELGISKRVHVQEDLGWAVLKVHSLDLTSSLEGGKGEGQDEVTAHHHHREEGEEEDDDSPAKAKSKRNHHHDDSAEKNVIGLRLALPRDKVVVELKILSELRLALVPRDHADKRGGLDFKLVGTPSTGSALVDRGLAEAMGAGDEHEAKQQLSRVRGFRHERTPNASHSSTAKDQQHHSQIRPTIAPPLKTRLSSSDSAHDASSSSSRGGGSSSSFRGSSSRGGSGRGGGGSINRGGGRGFSTSSLRGSGRGRGGNRSSAGGDGNPAGLEETIEHWIPFRGGARGTNAEEQSRGRGRGRGQGSRGGQQ